ncbi:MAG: hypothetical protein IT529_01070 [Burkholderiales bacterium]|nr:hypothetical protein [Burkholderiales bacterium]
MDRLLPACLMLGLLSFPAPAAEIRIEPRIGFHGVFQLGRPFPVAVTLESVGAPADGVLEIEVWKRGAVQGGAPYPMRYRRDVFLTARSRRTVQFTVEPDLLSRPLGIRFTSAAASASREVDLRRHFSPAPVILSVGEGGAVPLAALTASFTNRIVALGLAELPPEARALSGVSHLVLYDQSLRELSRVQLLALDAWLAAGGRMVVIGSLNFKLYQEPQLERYLPVRVTGVGRTTFAPEGGAGASAAVAGAWVQSATVLRGRVLARAQGMPVLVESDWGRGKVVYLALDAGRPPLAAWSGLPRLVQGLLAPYGEDNPVPRPQWNEAVFSRLLLDPWFVASYIPTRALFFAILGYLAVLVALVRLWQRRRIAWPALAAASCGWALCAAVGGHLYFGRGGGKPDGVLIEATVMDHAGDGYVEAQTGLALFSTQPRELSLGFGHGWLELMLLAAPGPAHDDRSVAYRHDGGVTRVQVPVPAWGYRLLRARAMERMGVSTEIEQRDGQVLLTVRNQGAADLADCHVAAPGVDARLGDLPRGASWTKRVAPGAEIAGNARDPAPGTDAILPRGLAFRERAHDILFHDSFFPRDATGAAWRGRAAVFFCWIGNPRSRVEPGDPGILVRAHALYRAIVALPVPEEE